MGLFSAFIGLFVGGKLTYDAYQNNQYDNGERNIALQNTEGAQTYLDSHGKIRFAPTNERCYAFNGKLYSVDTGRVLFDYDNLQEMNRRRWAKEIIEKYGAKYYKKNNSIKVYDIETHVPVEFVGKTINGKYITYVVNEDTGEVIREEDFIITKNIIDQYACDEYGNTGKVRMFTPVKKE